MSYYITIKLVVWSCMLQTQLHVVPMNLSQCTLQLSGTVLNCRADRDLTQPQDRTYNLCCSKGIQNHACKKEKKTEKEV